MKSYRRYPGYDLSECIDGVRLINERLGSGSHSSDALAEALGMSPRGGATKRKIAALGSFGLIVNSSQGYEVTQLAKKILRPLEGEYQQGLHEAFENVDLYSEVVEQYRDDGRLPKQLGLIFERKFRISEGNGDNASEIFLTSAKFAGIVDGDGNVTKSGPSASNSVEAPQVNSNDEIALSVHLPSHEPKEDLVVLELRRPKAKLYMPASITSEEKRRVLTWLETVATPWVDLMEEEEPEEVDN